MASGVSLILSTAKLTNNALVVVRLLVVSRVPAELVLITTGADLTGGVSKVKCQVRLGVGRNGTQEGNGNFNPLKAAFNEFILRKN